jgi:hypothetical protein
MIGFPSAEPWKIYAESAGTKEGLIEFFGEIRARTPPGPGWRQNEVLALNSSTSSFDHVPVKFENECFFLEDSETPKDLFSKSIAV